MIKGQGLITGHDASPTEAQVTAPTSSFHSKHLRYLYINGNTHTHLCKVFWRWGIKNTTEALSICKIKLHKIREMCLKHPNHP